MTIALINTNEKTKDWHDALEKELGQTIEIWPDIKDKSKIEFAIVSAPPEGAIAELPNLKAVQSLWAGVEHITGDASFPKHLPIIRMVDIGLTEGMQEYVTAQVLFHHLNMPKYVQDQRNTAWQPINPPLARHRKVAMLGLGHLGVACAKMLSDVGFKMLGWSRSQKTISGIDCYAGADGLDEVLREAEIIVNLLPNTPETTKLFDADKFTKCRRGIAFVNPGRGTVFDDQALISAIDTGQVSAVTLDVFWQEPLPKDHAFWSHPAVFITPHIASVTRIDTGAETAAKNLKHLMQGGEVAALEGVVDPKLGY